MIRVLVVEDDFRVARVHAEFTDRVTGFETIAIAHSAAQAREQLSQHDLDLILLDNYLPDTPGITLLSELDTDVMMLTAATDAASVRAALTAGALNYLIKPFTAEQLAERLAAYARYRQQLPATGRHLDQAAIDRAMRLLRDGDRPESPKGQSPITSQLVLDALRSAREPRSAVEIADELGIARATAQRYLAGLARTGKATMTLRYGANGRPEHEYESTLPN